MWRIRLTNEDVEISYEDKELKTNSLSLEALILQATQNPPVLYATPTGPAEVFDLDSSYLTYALVATILTEAGKDFQVTGDYLWPLDHNTTSAPAVFSYVDYLREGRADTVIASNTCHNPEGPGGGQFCAGGTISEPIKLNSVTTRNLHKELFDQGLRAETNPLFDVIDYVHGNRVVIARDKDGKIQGALTYSKERDGVHLQQIRIETDQKRTGFGTALVQAAAKDALTIKGQDNQVMKAHGTIQEAVPFHQKLGAVFRRDRKDKETGNWDWNGYGEYDHEATKTLAEGKKPTDNRIDPNDDSKFDPIYGYPKDHNPYAGPSYDQELKYYLEHKDQTSAQSENDPILTPPTNKYVAFLQNERANALPIREEGDEAHT